MPALKVTYSFLQPCQTQKIQFFYPASNKTVCPNQSWCIQPTFSSQKGPHLFLLFVKRPVVEKVDTL